MVVSMRSDVTDSNVAEGLAEDDPLRAALTAKPLRLATGFLGRYLIFGTIALAQATLVGLGDLFFLKVQHAHPVQFMATLWLTAIVFSFLLYTFIATFGNAGKALGVLFLVLQISGAGGSFPLAILPSFFSSVSPFLPATHAIVALRASIAGYSGHEYGDAMWFLASFILFAAFLGLALRPLLVRGNRRMVEKLEATEAAVRLALSGAVWGSWWAPSGTRQWPVVGVPRGRPGGSCCPLTFGVRGRMLVCPTVWRDAGRGELKTQEGMIGFDSGRRSK